MLVLTRKALEKIQIGRDVTVTVVEIRGRYVRLGIEAPKSVQIVRSELLTPAPVPVDQPTPLSHPISPPPR